MTMKTTTGVIDLLAMKEQMDVIVFDYIDTSKRWGKALDSLSVLQHQVIRHFKEYLTNNNGKLPVGNSYWLLFADIAAKLSYFIALATFEIQKEQQVELHVQEIERLLLLAANGYPSNDEEGEELLEQVFELYKQLPIPNVEQKIDELNNALHEISEKSQQALAYYEAQYTA